MIWVFAFLLRGRVVWLMDHKGETYKSIAYTNPFNTWCRVYWSAAIGHCVLCDGGKVTGESSSYIREWRYA